MGLVRKWWFWVVLVALILLVISLLSTFSCHGIIPSGPEGDKLVRHCHNFWTYEHIH